MSLIESIVSGTLNLINMYQQGSALFDVEGHEKSSVMAYLAKSADEVLKDKADGKPIGAEVVSKGINALVDYKVTTGLYDHLTSGDDPMNPMLASILSKGAGLIASSIAGKLAGGVADHLFGPSDTMDNANMQLAKNGRLNDLGKDPGMLARLEEMMGMGKDVGGVGSPLGGGTGSVRGSQAIG